MDCWIAASATVLKGVLLSEEKELNKVLISIPETKNLQIWSWLEYKNKKGEKK